MKRTLKPEYVFRPLQGLRRLWCEVSEPTGRRVVRLPWGVRYEIDLSDHIGRTVWRMGLYELVVCEVAWRLLEPGDWALDIGANIGIVASLMARRVGPGGSVTAFEPHPGVAADLRKSAGRSARENPECAVIDVREEALADCVGQGALVEGAAFPSSRGESRLAESGEAGISVRQVTLDEVVGERTVGLAKIDVEGRELRVLRGAESVLGGRRLRHVVFEGRPGEREAVIDSLRTTEYTVFALGHSLFGPLLRDAEHPEGVAPWETPNFLATSEPELARKRMAARGWACLRG